LLKSLFFRMRMQQKF